MSQSKSTSHVFGSVDIMNFADLKNTRITGIATPVLQNDGANKQYVDDKVVASNLTGGIGITVNTANNTINSNPSQTQIVALGNIQTGTWTANTIQIPYGGTGQTNFTVNKLIFHNSANKLASTPELTYDASTFSSSIPIIISNSTETYNTLSTTGSLIVNGGVNIAKRLYVGGDSMFQSGITVSNLTINGNLGLNDISFNNAQSTNLSAANIVASNIKVSNSLTSSNLITTNNTLANTVITSNTTTNAIFSNITSANINVNNIDVVSRLNSTTISNGNLFTFSSYTTNINSANTTITNLRVTNASINNLLSTNSTIVNLNVTTLLTSISSNLISLNSTNGTLINITNTNITNTNITNTNLISSNSTIASIVNTNISSSSGYITSISTSNIQGSGTITIANATTSNISTTNISATNSISTFSTVGTLRITGHSNLSTLSLTTITTANIKLTNLFNSNLNTQNSTTIGQLNVTGLSVFSTTNSTSMSTNTLYSNFSEHVTSSIGTLNVSGTIYTSNVTSNNLYASTLTNSLNILATNTTTTNLRSSTMLSTNLSTGTINVSGLTTTLNLSNTNSTITNILATNFTSTNFTSTNARITTSSQGNTSLVNSTTSNALTFNANTTTATTATLLLTKNATLITNYSGPPTTSAGSFITVYPSTFINNTTVSGGNVNAWYANYIGASTLSATNIGVITNRASNLYVKSNVVVGSNQSITYNSAMTLGYVANTTGGNMNTQINFERADGSTLAGIYTENATNRLVLINGSLSGGAGMGIYTVTDTPVIYSNIQSSTNVSPVPYIELLNSTSTFYSTVDSSSITNGSLVLNGGLGVGKTITSTSVVTSNLSADNCTLGNVVTGSITQSGYGLFSLSTSSYPPGDSNIEFNTTANFASGVSISIHPFTIGASIILENVVTFQYSGVYSIHMRLNSSTTTTSATLLQTNLNKYVGNQWQIYQTSSQNTTFDNYTDFHSHFMIETQANEHWKFTFNNGYVSNFTFDIDNKKTRLMINKVG